MSTITFDPIPPELNCRNCGRPIYAVAEIHDSSTLQIQGLRQYMWSHSPYFRSPLGDVCAAPDNPPVAEPYDGWEATRRVEAVRAARRKAEDAYLEATEDLGWRVPEWAGPPERLLDENLVDAYNHRSGDG